MPEEAARAVVDTDAVAALTRVRPQANPEHKREFAQQFNRLLDMIGVPPGEPFYIVTAGLWDGLKDERDAAIDQQREAEVALEVKGKDRDAAREDYEQKTNAMRELLDDLERGIIDVTELRDKFVTLSGDFAK